jgi:hypothetical protein
MENNIVNTKLKKYIHYLNKIGLIPEEDNFQVNNIFYQLGKLYINTNEILTSNFGPVQNYFNDTIIKAISLFLNSLTPEKNSKISFNLYQNYLEKEKLLNIEKAYTINKLFRNLQMKRAFKKIYFFSKSNYNYNFLYTMSPNISTNALDYSPNLKKIPNFIRNLDDNNNKVRLSNIGRLIESSSQIINTQGENKSISKISDIGINCTFTNENSPFIKRNDSVGKNFVEEKKINYASHKQNLFQLKNNYNNQLFNKRANLKLKLTPHFEFLGNERKSTKSQEITKENTTEFLKEQEEIKNCTFKPKINKINKTPILSIRTDKINNSKRIEKLYLDNQRKLDKRAESILLRDRRLSRENTFQPNFVSISVKKLKKNFSLRMQKFNKIKEEKKKKLMKSLETDYNSIYTFSPKLNKNPHQINNNSKIANKKIPAYERLYNKNKNPKRKSNEEKKEQKSSLINNNNKSVDFQKIQKLYEEYKLQKQKRKKEQKLIDKERGLTFNPLLINGNKYLDKIVPGFFEREKKFVEDHNNHINAYRNFLNKEKQKHFKRYSEDKKIIVKNVVNRLYNEEMKKNINIISKNKNYYIKTENNKTSENFDGKESIILTKSNKSYGSLNLNKNEGNKIKNSESNKEIQISIKSSGNFSLSQLINDKN